MTWAQTQGLHFSFPTKSPVNDPTYQQRIPTATSKLRTKCLHTHTEKAILVS